MSRVYLKSVNSQALAFVVRTTQKKVNAWDEQGVGEGSEGLQQSVHNNTYLPYKTVTDSKRKAGN